MGKPAARLGDMTSHGGTIVSGSANVFFNGMPAAHVLSMHLFPMVTLRDAERGTLLASDTIARGDALELLIPDSRRLQISVDGSVCCREMKG